MLKVNTIEFNGERACINSYSEHPELVKSRVRQFEEWSARFPKAIVRTEDMSEHDTCALVAEGRAKAGDHNNYAYHVGKMSEQA